MMELIQSTFMSQVTNTPGFLYGIAYCLGLLVSILVCRKKGNGRQVTLRFLILSAFIITSMVLTDGILPQPLFIPFEIVVFLLMTLALYCCCDFRNGNACFYYACRSFMMGEFGASLHWQIYYFLVHSMGMNAALIWGLLHMAADYILVFGILYLLERKINRNPDEIVITRGAMLQAIIVTAGFYAVSNLSYVLGHTPFTTSFTSELYIIRTITDLGALAVLAGLHMQITDSSIRLENELLQQTLQLQYDNYKLSEETIALVNQKYHDLRHQIHLLRSGMENSAQAEYLHQMEREIKSYEAQFRTGNKILDTILTAKDIHCQSVGIQMICVADGESLGFMEPMDISALFGNAVENAIESVEKIADPDRRLIHITVGREKSFLRIRVENCCDEKVIFKAGLPVTSKGDERYHGYGTRSIRSIVDKYKGSMTIKADDGWYRLRILFPLDT